MTPENAAAIVADAYEAHDAPAYRYAECIAPGTWIVQTYDGARHVITVTVTSEATR